MFLGEKKIIFYIQFRETKIWRNPLPISNVKVIVPACVVAVSHIPPQGRMEDKDNWVKLLWNE